MKQASFVFVLVIFNYLFDFIDYLFNLADLILQDFGERTASAELA